MVEHYSYKSDFADISIEDGIVRVMIIGKIDSDKALVIVRERIKVTSGKSYPTLADYRYGNALDKKAREIFAGPDAMKNVTAGAILFSNAMHRIFINAYLWLEKPPVPTGVFTSEKKALQWLSIYKLSDN